MIGISLEINECGGGAGFYFWAIGFALYFLINLPLPHWFWWISLGLWWI
jgi:hypothetical protein